VILLALTRTGRGRGMTICYVSMSVCLYVCMSVCLSVCLYVCLYVCVSVCTYVPVRNDRNRIHDMGVCGQYSVHLFAMLLCCYVCMYVCMYVCCYVCMYVCMYVPMYVCTCEKRQKPHKQRGGVWSAQCTSTPSVLLLSSSSRRCPQFRGLVPCHPCRVCSS
jgi:hypothetical protein